MKILVRGANWIGDAVMTIPALRALRSIYPAANITLYTKAWAEGVFRDADFIDRILKVEDQGSGFIASVKESRRVAAGDYDIALLFTNSFQTAAVVRMAGIKSRVGYSREGRGFLLTHAIKRKPGLADRHQAFYYLNLVEEAAKRLGDDSAAPPSHPDGSLPVDEERRVGARNLLDRSGVDRSKPTIAFGVGSTNSAAKRWGEAKYAKLADLFAENFDSNILLVGSKDETEVSGQVSALSKADVIDLTGTTDLATATAILSEIDLFVSNDMGLAHIAAAVGTKTLVIFGPTDDIATRPFSHNADIIRHPVECSPCMLRDCPIDHRCMVRLEPETVFAKAIEMLNE
jgi:heptosyltransferase-2